MANIFHFFVSKILPLIILATGLCGNCFGLMTVSSKKLKIVPLVIMKGLFIMDTVYLIQIIPHFLNTGLEINILKVSSFVCKTFRYIQFSLDAVSPWLIVYLSVDRLVTIRYFSRKNPFKNKTVQLSYVFTLLTFNFFYYLPIAFYYDNLVSNQTSNETLICAFTSSKAQLVLSTLDAINMLLAPFTVMLICSILLIVAVVMSSKRVITNYTHRENKRFYQDIRFAFTTVSLNLVFFALNLPLVLAVYLMTEYKSTLFHVCNYMFYASYAADFFVFFISNSQFRQAFLARFSSKSENNFVSVNLA